MLVAIKKTHTHTFVSFFSCPSPSPNPTHKQPHNHLHTHIRTQGLPFKTMPADGGGCKGWSSPRGTRHTPLPSNNRQRIKKKPPKQESSSHTHTRTSTHPCRITPCKADPHTHAHTQVIPFCFAFSLFVIVAAPDQRVRPLNTPSPPAASNIILLYYHRVFTSLQYTIRSVIIQQERQ